MLDCTPWLCLVEVVSEPFEFRPILLLVFDGWPGHEPIFLGRQTLQHIEERSSSNDHQGTTEGDGLIPFKCADHTKMDVIIQFAVLLDSVDDVPRLRTEELIWHCRRCGRLPALIGR